MQTLTHKTTHYNHSINQIFRVLNVDYYKSAVTQILFFDVIPSFHLLRNTEVTIIYLIWLENKIKQNCIQLHDDDILALISSEILFKILSASQKHLVCYFAFFLSDTGLESSFLWVCESLWSKQLRLEFSFRTKLSNETRATLKLRASLYFITSYTLELRNRPVVLN